MFRFQAETNINDDGEKKTLKIPIAVLKVGETRSLRPNVEFPNGSVTFKLVQGSGPVHVCGKVSSIHPSIYLSIYFGFLFLTNCRTLRSR